MIHSNNHHPKTQEEIFRQMKIFAEAYYASNCKSIREDLDALVEEYFEKFVPEETRERYRTFYLVRRTF